MDAPPRFHAENVIRQYLDELKRYESAFVNRIVSTFANLDEEAKRIEEAEYARLDLAATEHSDPADAAEAAFGKGLDYYLTVSAVRQGIFNLMVAGLFHLLEQQCQYLATWVLTGKVAKPDPMGGVYQLKNILDAKWSIRVETFAGWQRIEELRLVANTVKHGDGPSSEKLRALRADLFSPLKDFALQGSSLPIRPLVGEGLYLTEGQFAEFKASIEDFWTQLIATLLPVFQPPREVRAMREVKSD
jgi:hypothetical protein